MRTALACLALLLIGCRGPADPQPAPATEAAVAVWVDGAEAGSFVLPTTDTRDLADLLPSGLPPYGDWAMVRVRGAGGRSLDMKAPAKRTGEVLRATQHDGEPALGLFLRAGPDASTSVRDAASRPQQLVLAPESLHIHTTMPVPEVPSMGVLRVKVNGKGAGQLRTEELTGLARTPEPGRPQHEGGFLLADVVALRADAATVLGVEVVARDGSRTELGAPSSPANALTMLKPNKKGEWVLKRHEAPSPGGAAPRGLTVRQVELIDLRTGS